MTLHLIVSCDLLEKSYLCGINNNKCLRTKTVICVVICLKSLTFVVSITTLRYFHALAVCCDLLEKSYLCGINNNLERKQQHKAHVVICLKSLTFVVSITTPLSINTPDISCDLLEKSYLCGINNNGKDEDTRTPAVVICLKSLTFVVSITTCLMIMYCLRLL